MAIDLEQRSRYDPNNNGVMMICELLDLRDDTL